MCLCMFLLLMCCICLIWGLLMSRMNATRHCDCMGRCDRHQRLGKIPGASLVSHLERVEIFLHVRLAEVPNDCLRFDHNQAFFFLLTLSGGPCGIIELRNFTLGREHSRSLGTVVYVSGNL